MEHEKERKGYVIEIRKMENARKIWADILAQHQFKASLRALTF